MNFTTRYQILITAACLAIAGCKNNDGSTNTDPDDASREPPAGLMGEAATAARAEAAVASLPKPNLARPLSDYAKIDSGEQLMFLYVAASRLPPDFEKLASQFSSEYRQTSDTFRKRDLLVAIKPQVQARINAAVQDPYGWMEVAGRHVGPYDFDRGGFPINEFTEGTTRYFHDNNTYKLTWDNSDAVQFAPVKDEAVAREIESMRSSYDQHPRLKVYFFAQAAGLQDETIKAYVTRVQITDRTGRVLAEYGPTSGAGPSS